MARGRLQGGGGERAAQIGLVEPDHAQAGGLDVSTQPAERPLIRDRQQYQGV